MAVCLLFPRQHRAGHGPLTALKAQLRESAKQNCEAALKSLLSHRLLKNVEAGGQCWEYVVTDRGFAWHFGPASKTTHGLPDRDSCYRAHQFEVAGVEACVLVPETIREWCRCHVLRPLLRALRGGVTPRRLAWSLAFGIVVGINPSVGLTSLVVVVVAWTFGLNKLASLLGAHVVTPLHLLLFLPFIELGVHLFHTHRLPMDRPQLEHLSHHPLRLFHDIWQWEWHALIVWAAIAVVAMPLLALYLRRALVGLLRRHKTLLRSRPAVH